MFRPLVLAAVALVLTAGPAPARAGDHPEIYQFLLAVFQGPSREEFHAVQDEPSYDPGQRLLMKREGRIAAHLQLSHRTMCFGELRLPINRVVPLTNSYRIFFKVINPDLNQTASIRMRVLLDNKVMFDQAANMRDAGLGFSFAYGQAVRP